MSQIKEWLLSRDPRERKLIIVGAALLILLLLHAMVWSPLVNGYRNQQQQLLKLQKDVAWMRGAALKLRSSQRPNTKSTTNTQGSIPTLIDRSARITKIIGFIKRVEPRGSDKVQVIIEQANFNHLLTWIDVMRSRFKINVSQINVVRGPKAGLINARIILGRIN